MDGPVCMFKCDVGVQYKYTKYRKKWTPSYPPSCMQATVFICVQYEYSCKYQVRYEHAHHPFWEEAMLQPLTHFAIYFSGLFGISLMVREVSSGVFRRRSSSLGSASSGSASSQEELRTVRLYWLSRYCTVRSSWTGSFSFNKYRCCEAWSRVWCDPSAIRRSLPMRACDQQGGA
jgi:hypothetical protein